MKGEPTRAGERVGAEREAMVREKIRAARSSVLASAFLTSIKIAAGLLTGSLGILAEAAHSALDFGAALMTLVAVRASSRPPDREHHYGHGKIENLTALAEGGLLVLTSVWILWEAAERFIGRGPEVDPSLWGFLVIGLSIVVDVVRSRDLARVAKKSGSQALEADALHFSTDIASSAVVILGLGGVWLGRRLEVAGLTLADSVAASVVAIIVLVLSVRLSRRAIDMLLDRAPAGLAERVEVAVLGLGGIVGRPQIRLRQAGDRVFADLTVCIDRALPIAEGERLATQLRHRVGTVIGSDEGVNVQVIGSLEEESSLPTRVATAVAMTGVRAHDISVRLDGTDYYVDFHIELPATMTLREGHAIADEIERRVRHEVPQIRRVDVHLELAAERPAEVGPLSEGQRRELERQVARAAATVPGLAGVHDLVMARTEAGLFISCHCLVPAETTIAAAHALTEALEAALRRTITGLDRVVVHAEPDGQHR